MQDNTSHPASPESPYGRKPRSALDGYAPIPYAQHRREYVRAVHGKGRSYDAYLVEEHEDGTVTLLPEDATPYAWRTIWRKVIHRRVRQEQP